MTTILVEFDGATFVPKQAVNLPVGTQVTVAIPDSTTESVSNAPSTPDDPEWRDIVNQIRSVQPEPATVEEAMRQIRMRP
jgi:hypothetical protein